MSTCTTKINAKLLKLWKHHVSSDTPYTQSYVTHITLYALHNLITHNDGKDNSKDRADQSPPTAQEAHAEGDTHGINQG